MISVRILCTRFTPGPNGERQFLVGELVRLISDIGTVHPGGTVVSNDGVTFEVEWDFGCGRTSFDLKAEQAAMKAAEQDAIVFLKSVYDPQRYDTKAVTAEMIRSLTG